MTLRNAQKENGTKIGTTEDAKEDGTNKNAGNNAHPIDRSTLTDLERKYAEVMKDTFQIIAAKDAQIETDKHSNSQTERQIMNT